MNEFKRRVADMANMKDETAFNPNESAKEIEQEQLVEFVKILKGTSHEGLIVYKDPKVQELIDFIAAAIIQENSRLNDDTYPIQIYRRYKSNHSLYEKIKDWSQREDRLEWQIPDYLGFRIVPTSEHSIFYSGDDDVLQGMINKRENNREFIAKKYKEIHENSNMTFSNYCKICGDVIDVLSSLFPEEATDRKKYYSSLKELVEEDYAGYTSLMEDSDSPMYLDEILAYTKVNIKDLLQELTLNNPNEVILYKLKKDLLNTFENSSLLNGLRNICIRRYF